MSSENKIPADVTFTPDEVENLAHNQTAHVVHPFTCPNRGDGAHREAYGDLGALVATVRGWVCPFCDYTQNWAHDVQKAHKFQPPTFGSMPNIASALRSNREGE